MKEINIEISGDRFITEMKISNLGEIGERDYMQAALLMVFRASEKSGRTTAEIIDDLKAIDNYTQREPDIINDFADAVKRTVENA